MLKKFVGGAVAAGLLAVSSVAATAAPGSLDSLTRASSPVDASEGLAGGNELALLALFGALVIGIIVLVEETSDGPDLPVSP